VTSADDAWAAAWGLGFELDAIRDGLRSYRGDDAESPARFNVLDAGSATVIVDYAHNPSALEAVIAGLDAFRRPHRTMVTSGSNRRDEDLVDMGRMMAGAFDRVILYADWGHSGRNDGELNALLRQGLAAGPRLREIEEVPSERDAIDRALAALQSGELLVLGVEAIEESLAHIRARLRPIS
jgi:cyanophycin synthetase